MIKKIIFFCASIALISCGGGGGGGSEEPPVNNAPSKVNLIYPTENLLCIDNNITFDWSDATDPNNDAVRYKVIVAKNRDLSSVVKSQTISASNVRYNLEKGVAHYWRVTSVDSKGKEGEPSAVFAFFTKGTGTSNIAPFTAELESPADQGSVSGTSVTLKWKGADSNTGDTLKYDIYFGENSDPELKESSVTSLSYDVTVESGKTYYWKINTIDDSNAKSIGQVWRFTVN